MSRNYDYEAVVELGARMTFSCIDERGSNCSCRNCHASGDKPDDPEWHEDDCCVAQMLNRIIRLRALQSARLSRPEKPETITNPRRLDPLERVKLLAGDSSMAGLVCNPKDHPEKPWQGVFHFQLSNGAAWMDAQGEASDSPHAALDSLEEALEEGPTEEDEG